MENKVTVLYYSANVENEAFERSIMDNIMKQKGDLPLISVTQKPTDFGDNICVGKQRCCYFNEFRQIQIGLKFCKTPYVLTAEADCLYPPEYFKYDPKEEDIVYRYGNVWVHYINHYKPCFRYKGFSDGSQLISRDLWLQKIEEALSPYPNIEWLKEGDESPKLLAQFGTDHSHTWAGDPVVTFKTTAGVSQRTQLSKRKEPTETLPYWGEIIKLRKDYHIIQ